ncbi:hypothetical protein LSTR_LSTR000959 [Laodelphax striatellus]|uniref:C2H2-type domain-containing protein n=1 Tax=Laodelphax striatellus TaxID=195883 RepID=A0A482X0Z6_LAOST|nr:hypothetical protein LSTR_LSTR000959 [Laodelphax striatellus]
MVLKQEQGGDFFFDYEVDAEMLSISCDKCGKQFKRKSAKSEHMKACGEEPRFSCPYCPHRTARRRNMRTHVAIKHRCRYP